MKIIEIPIHAHTTPRSINIAMEGVDEKLKEYKIQLIPDKDINSLWHIVLVILIAWIEKRNEREKSGKLLNKIMQSTNENELIGLAKEFGLEIEILPNTIEDNSLFDAWRSNYLIVPSFAGTRKFGSMKGQLTISPDFEEPLADFNDYL